MPFIIQHNIKTIKPHRRAVNSGIVPKKGGRNDLSGKGVFDNLTEARDYARGPLMLRLRKYAQGEIRLVILNADTLEQVDRLTVSFVPEIGQF
jgi:hypothetical protein